MHVFIKDGSLSTETVGYKLKLDNGGIPCTLLEFGCELATVTFSVQLEKAHIHRGRVCWYVVTEGLIIFYNI